MSKIKMEIAVGILFLFGMAVMGYFTLIMKDEIYDAKEYKKFEVEFPAAAGLKKGDAVTVLGVYSGEVTSVELDGNKVLVGAKVFNEFIMYENYKIKIRAEGALGDKFVDIQPGKEFDEERSFAVITLNERLIGDKSGDILVAIEDLIAKNENVLSESVENINDITQNIKILTSKINRGEGTLGKLLSDDSTLNQADELLYEVKETIEDAREQAPVTSFIRAALTAF